MTDPQKPWLERTLLAITVLCALVLLVKCGRQLWVDPPYDFQVYWNIGRMFSSGDTDVYGWTAGRNEWIYLYPPFFAVLCVPLSWFEMSTAYRIWTLVQIPLGAATLLGLWRLCAADSRRAKTYVAFAAIVPLMMAYYRNIEWGQVNLLTLCLAVWGLSAITRMREGRGGAWLAAAIHVKVMPVALLPVLLIQRRFKAVLATFVALLVFTLMPALALLSTHGTSAFGQSVDMHAEYVNALVTPQTTGRDSAVLAGDTPANFAPSQVLKRANGALGTPLPEKAAAWLGALVALAMFGTACVFAWKWHDPLRATTALGLALVAALLGQVTLWSHHLVLMAIALSAYAMLVQRGQAVPWVLWLSSGALFCLFGVIQSERVEAFEWLRASGVPTMAIVGAWGLLTYGTFAAEPEPAKADAPEPENPHADSTA
ncbi:MAG: glycosyltransferase family 87 protein [Planctomycetota bacterium]